ncbi:hypothetical protein ACI65C_007324 [Semiaphis heraclei]
MEGITEDNQINETLQPIPHNQTEKTETNFTTPCEPHKRPLSENSSLASSASSPMTADKIDKISEGLKPAEDIFSNESPISSQQFKYVLENYTNKNLNIHSICKDINSDSTSRMHLIDSIRPKIPDRTFKAHLTRLANFLFQALPPPQDN